MGTSEKLSILKGGGKSPASVMTMEKVAPDPRRLISTRMKFPLPSASRTVRWKEETPSMPKQPDHWQWGTSNRRTERSWKGEIGEYHMEYVSKEKEGQFTWSLSSLGQWNASDDCGRATRWVASAAGSATVAA